MISSTIFTILPKRWLCKFAINLSFLEFIKNHHQKLHNLKGTKHLLIKSTYTLFSIPIPFYVISPPPSLKIYPSFSLKR